MDLVEDDLASVDYPLQYVHAVLFPARTRRSVIANSCCRVRKFQGVSNVTLYIEGSYGENETKIYYIGLKGESKKVRALVTFDRSRLAK